MRLYTGKILHSYECTQLTIGNYAVEQVKLLSSVEKGPLVTDKYPMLELILDETQEEAPDIINEYELEVEDVANNDGDNVQ